MQTGWIFAATSKGVRRSMDCFCGCHTAVANGYVIEGLIPAENIKRVLNAHSPIKGLSVPGMSAGAPGMPGNKKGPINVYYLEASSTPRNFSSF